MKRLITRPRLYYSRTSLKNRRKSYSSLILRACGRIIDLTRFFDDTVTISDLRRREKINLLSGLIGNRWYHLEVFQ